MHVMIDEDVRGGSRLLMMVTRVPCVQFIEFSAEDRATVVDDRFYPREGADVARLQAEHPDIQWELARDPAADMAATVDGRDGVRLIHHDLLDRPVEPASVVLRDTPARVVPACWSPPSTTLAT